MNTRSKLLCLAWLSVLPAVAWAGDRPEPRTIRRSLPLQAQQDVSLDLRWGELEISSTDGAALEVTVIAECDRDDDRCPERLADVDIESRTHRERLDVEVIGLSKWTNHGASIRLVVGVPRQHRLTVDMGAGEITIEDFAADLEVDLGAGEIRVRMPEDAVRRVDLTAGVGEATLRRRDGDIESERAHLIGSSVRWAEGRGQSRVDCRVGAGEVAVRLD